MMMDNPYSRFAEIELVATIIRKRLSFDDILLNLADRNKCDGNVSYKRNVDGLISESKRADLQFQGLSL